MTFRIVNFKEEHGLDIIYRNQREGLTSGVPSVSPKKVVKIWGKSKDSYTMMKDGVPVFCAGVVDIGWQRGEAWTLVSRLFYENKKVCYRVVKNFLKYCFENNQYQRIQSVISPDLDAGESWMRHLGFTKEGTLRKFGPNNEDVVMYSRVRQI